MEATLTTSHHDAATTDVVNEDTERLVREIGIPPCPAILTDLMQETRKDEPDFRRVSHLIGRDAGLAASVLKTVNSPFYGLRTKARSVRDALNLLGMRNAANLVSGLMLRKAFRMPKSAAMEEFWELTSKVALITGYLGRELEAADLDEAHTFGLFRDCGIPVLMAKFADYPAMMQATRGEVGPWVTGVERERYGVDHAAVGAALARSWHLPDTTCNAIERHHGYDLPAEGENAEASARLAALGLLAECVYRAHRGDVMERDWAAEEESLERVLNVDLDALEALRQDITRILAGR